VDQRRTESRHDHSDGLHARDGMVVLDQILTAQIAALQSLRPVMGQIRAAADAATQALRRGGKMGYAGAGSSGLMALADCLELPGTFGISPEQVPMMFAGGAQALLHMQGGVEDDPALALADLDRSGLGAGDVVLCLAASGGTPYTLTIARQAQAKGVVVVGFANVDASPLLRLADIPVLLDTGPEIISGSTRMGAGTTQKVALNMLSVLVGIGLGHVHDGYMVNVVADNAKLIDRAARIVEQLASVTPDAARHALSQSGGAVKPAILIAKGASPEQAARALHETDWHLAPHLINI
jgi:N-acetylmuramic acid 6-phosphate etherase